MTGCLAAGNLPLRPARHAGQTLDITSTVTFDPAAARRHGNGHPLEITCQFRRIPPINLVDPRHDDRASPLT